MKSVLEKYLPLEANSSGSRNLAAQRQKDHYSHFILRLAFSSTEDLRRRFTRVETMLFRLRFGQDALKERAGFVAGLDLDWWDPVTEEERAEYAADFEAMLPRRRAEAALEDETWFKVDWLRVPDLVEGRKVFLKHGKAYVPGREQASMVVAEFSSRLDRQLEVRADRKALAEVHVRQVVLTEPCSSSPRGLSRGSTRTTD